ncbi:MAG: hypothetical protein KAG66_04410 [Methylococcales bacterium]|nr:hypothetical protein [Methylococcales bacterium]
MVFLDYGDDDAADADDITMAIKQNRQFYMHSKLLSRVLFQTFNLLSFADETK